MQNIEELAHCLGREEEEIYQEIRRSVFDEIAFRELSITRILQDLIKIRKKNQKHADVLIDAVALPFSSYAEIADRNEISKQAVFSILRKYSADYSWIDGVMQIKAIQNSRGKPDSKSRKRIAKWAAKGVQLDLFKK